MTAHKKELLAGQKPVPKGDVDASYDIDLHGWKVQVATYQGDREYQEDKFLVSELPDMESKNAQTFLGDIFAEAAKQTNRNRAGATATGVVITKDLQLNSAFLGDSPVVVFVHDPKTGDVTANKLTRDHHARDPQEKARIEEEGGYVAWNGRVDGSLELSRAFGDAGMKGVSRLPEYASADLKKDVDAGRDVYVCVSSDGLYASLEADDYKATLKQAIDEGKEHSLADIFCARAYHSRSHDNITALVLKVPKDMGENLFMAVSDGHGGGATSKKVVASFTDSLLNRKP
jgi:serine/threonine protein phosphatase PrpC